VSKGRFYVEGQSRALDDLAKTYEKLEDTAAWVTRPEVPEERSVKDPLGLSAKKKPSVDPFGEGKEAAVRVTRFIALCASEMQLAPEQTIFAVELAALNTLNARDCPVKQDRINEIREMAFKYYAQSLPKIPNPK
jgi:hypothetical protein